jgi:methyltransferase (TIGR00027 family)
MEPVSDTAKWVALARALEGRQKKPLFVDDLAKEFIRRYPPDFTQPPIGSADFFAVRTRFFDDFLTRAAASGISQVVLLAAGLDSRAFRLVWPAGTHLFEVDLAGLLREKEAVLAEVGAEPRCTRTPVASDLRSSWLADLLAAGFRPDAPTAWLVEGILYYLAPDEADRLIATLSEAAAPGSVLGAEHIGNGVFRSESLRPFLAKLRRRGCGWNSGVDEPEQWLAGHGWQAAACEAAALGAMHGRWQQPSGPAAADGLRTWLMTAVNDARAAHLLAPC